MKKLFSLSLTIGLSVNLCFGQTTPPNTPIWPLTGNVSIGLLRSNGSQLQLHGVNDFKFTIPPQGFTSVLGNVLGGLNVLAQPSLTFNFGKTSRLGLTNLSTGQEIYDGFAIQQSELNAHLINQEGKDLSLLTGSSQVVLDGSTGKIWFNGAKQNLSFDQYATLNLDRQTDNGLYIRCVQPGYYGINIRMSNNNDNSIQIRNRQNFISSKVTASGQVYGTSFFVQNPEDNVKNFSVNLNGEVFARKYTTTLANIPDYVFDSNYKLLSFDELRIYLETKKHLPNIPSANEFEKVGVDLGEMNRLLLEKVEELTLYILQLEKRVQKVEHK